MNVKRIVAENMKQALRQISHEMGSDAVIVSTKKLDKGIEVVAALGYDSDDPADQQQEVERQVTLQRELEAARMSLNSQGMSSREKEQRQAFVQQQDLSNPNGIKRALSGLKDGQYPEQGSHIVSDGEGKEQPHQPMDPSLDEVKGELRELKDWLVSHQGSAWDTQRPLTWQQSQLWQRCQDIGLEPAWADRVVADIPEDMSLTEAWQETLRAIQNDLPVDKTDILEKGGCFAFLGPTGAGKTTTIGKIAAQFVLKHGKDSVALLTLDNYRIAAHDQFRTFARILGVEMSVIPQGADINNILQKVRHKKLVLIDSAGLGTQDPHFSEQLSMLKKTGVEVRKLLVLPLTNQARCLQENYEHFKPVGLNGCVFSKLDECFSLGAAMSVAALTRLPINLVANGPHIPDDLQYPEGEYLVKLAEQMACMARTRWQAAEAMNMASQQKSFQHGV